MEDPANNNTSEIKKKNVLLQFWDTLYSLTIVKEGDGLLLWGFKMFLRSVFFLLLVAISPFILLGLFLTFLMAL